MKAAEILKYELEAIDEELAKMESGPVSDWPTSEIRMLEKRRDRVKERLEKEGDAIEQ
jgi:hypothetical protein